MSAVVAQPCIGPHTARARHQSSKMAEGDPVDRAKDEAARQSALSVHLAVQAVAMELTQDDAVQVDLAQGLAADVSRVVAIVGGCSSLCSQC